jgi:hypothetical protein
MADETAAQQGLGHPNDEAFGNSVLIAGRSCRDALKRVCRWHKDRGAKDLNCEVGALELRRELDAGAAHAVFHFGSPPLGG